MLLGTFLGGQNPSRRRVLRRITGGMLVNQAIIGMPPELIFGE